MRLPIASPPSVHIGETLAYATCMHRMDQVASPKGFGRICSGYSPPVAVGGVAMLCGAWEASHSPAACPCAESPPPVRKFARIGRGRVGVGGAYFHMPTTTLMMPTRQQNSTNTSSSFMAYAAATGTCRITNDVSRTTHRTPIATSTRVPTYENPQPPSHTCTWTFSRLCIA